MAYVRKERKISQDFHEKKPCTPKREESPENIKKSKIHTNSQQSKLESVEKKLMNST